jgi:hypothetical protein
MSLNSFIWFAAIWCENNLSKRHHPGTVSGDRTRFAISPKGNTSTTAEGKGYDAGKTSGIKLHSGVDTGGLPHAVWITSALKIPMKTTEFHGVGE